MKDTRQATNEQAFFAKSETVITLMKCHRAYLRLRHSQMVAHYAFHEECSRNARRISDNNRGQYP